MDKVAYYEEMILNDVLEKEAMSNDTKNILYTSGAIGTARALGGGLGGAVKAKRISKQRGETKEEARKRMRREILRNAANSFGEGAFSGATAALVSQAIRDVQNK